MLLILLLRCFVLCCNDTPIYCFLQAKIVQHEAQAVVDAQKVTSLLAAADAHALAHTQLRAELMSTQVALASACASAEKRLQVRVSICASTCCVRTCLWVVCVLGRIHFDHTTIQFSQFGSPRFRSVLHV